MKHHLTSLVQVTMPKITHDVKLEIVNMYRNGYSTRRIHQRTLARSSDITYNAVKYHISQYQKGMFDPEQAPLVSIKPLRQTDVEKEILTTTLETDPCISARDVRKILTLNGSEMSEKSVSRAMAEAGYVHSKPRYCQLIRDINKVKRVEFCQELVACNDTLDSVIFTDESTIQLFNNKVIAYRKDGMPAVHIGKPKHPLKIHVWAGISKRGATDIVIFEDIMDASFFSREILQGTVKPFVQNKFPDGHRFQQDNDPKHRSKLAKDTMRECGINWWDSWPSESPDLNPIELVWNQLKRFVSRQEPRSKTDLVTSVLKFWKDEMTTEQCIKYIEHIYKVVPVCILMGGKATGDMPNRIFQGRSRGKSIRYFSECLKTSEMKENFPHLFSQDVCR